MRRLLTLQQVGVVTNRSTRAVREMIVRKLFPFSKVGGKLYVEEDELNKFLRLSRKISAVEAVNNRSRKGAA